MKVGVVREVKVAEQRVALTPSGARTLIGDGHEVLVEASAGLGGHFTDTDYVAAGATIATDAAAVWGGADMIVKVKEPKAEEFGFLRPDQILFTYLHLAAYPAVSAALTAAGTTAIAYETVQAGDGSLPLLAPMSEIAGRMAAQVAAHCLERPNGGRGVLMGGASGVEPANVVVVGGGIAGVQAATIAAGMRADVQLFDTNLARLRDLDRVDLGRIRTRAASPASLADAAVAADVVIGAVLLPGARAPIVLDEDTIAAMAPGSVLVDISIDQGGCFATSRETTHAEPTYERHGVVHYCVGNIPGAVPRTSTIALTNATLPYMRAIAGLGVDAAIAADPVLAGGLNVRGGEIVHAAVAGALAVAA